MEEVSSYRKHTNTNNKNPRHPHYTDGEEFLEIGEGNTGVNMLTF